ncbi:MAG: 50S ribosomal protein L21 [Planctomycetota bacterium]|nr:50S ribosomal protein L21 [Planctomycetota bacterium]
MYAIIEDSGQQFRVSEGDVLNVDTRELAEKAKEIEFDRVLLVSDDGNAKVGAPLLAKAKVLAEIIESEAKGLKVYAAVWRRRKNSRRRVGHRQKYLRVRITKIVA